MSPTIYALQGLAVTPDVWDDLKQALPELRVVCPDVVALAERGDGTLAGLLRKLAEQAPAGPLLLVGSSIGAHVALELAAFMGDRVVGSLLLAPGPAVTDEEFSLRVRGLLRVLENWTDEAARSLIPLLLYRFSPRYPANEKRLARMLSIAAPRSPALLNLAAGFQSAPDLLPRLHGPVHVLVGADNGNPVTGPAVYDTWRGVLPEGVERIPSASEYMQMDRPELVADAIRAMVARVSA